DLYPAVGLYTIFLFLCEEKASGVLVDFVHLWDFRSTYPNWTHEIPVSINLAVALEESVAILSLKLYHSTPMPLVRELLGEEKAPVHPLCLPLCLPANPSWLYLLEPRMVQPEGPHSQPQAERLDLVGEMLPAENKDSFLPARQKGSYLTCLDVSRKHGSRARPPLFDGEDYNYWKTRMEFFLRGYNYQLWTIIEEGDLIVLNLREEWIDNDRKLLSQNCKTKNLICCALTRSEFNMISVCKSTKEMWDKLKLTYEGTDKVNETRIDILVTQYEKFQMLTGETITQMYRRFTDITNGLAGLGKMYNTGDMGQSLKT
ncbi:hypothetical protein Taro_051513, partial [Colocasia esculenta]|nr:hypothetical protein [Colocasia esculenta]